MKNMIEDIQDFITKFKFDAEEMDIDKLKFRMSLLSEEYIETMYAFKKKDFEEVIDGLIDLIVIAIGTLQLSGVDTQKAWNEVHRANMSKERGIKPGREESKGFDCIKPYDFRSANHNDNHGILDKFI